MPRKPLPGYGVRGVGGRRGASVRAWIETRGAQPALVRVQWREHGRRLTQSWPDTRANRDVARAFAEGVEVRLARLAQAAAAGAPAPVAIGPRTVRDVWGAFTAARFDAYRVATRRNMTAHWSAFELFVGATRVAAEVTRETLDRFVAAYRRTPTARGQARSAAQVRRTVTAVLTVFRWAVDRELIPPTRVLEYRLATTRHQRAAELRASQVPEYTREEVRAILGALDDAPRDPRRWRLYVLCTLFAFAGPRQQAARLLTWEDVDFPGARLHWRGEHDKMGTDRWQPVPAPVVEALRVAYGWRTASGYTGPYVLFRPAKGARRFDPRRGVGGRWQRDTAREARAAAVEDRPWTYAAFWTALRALEREVGVPHRPWRASHSFRRHVVTELLARTGNLVLAGRYVGDRDLRTLTRSYVRDRDDDLAAAGALLLDGLDGSATDRQPPPETADGAASPAPSNLKSHTD